jgi:hypothetical protein
MRHCLPKLLFCGLCTLLFLVPFQGGAVAQENPVKSVLEMVDAPFEKQDGPMKEDVTEFEADQLTHEYHMTKEKYKLYECILLALFALVSLVILMLFLCNKTTCSATQLVNASGIIFIIFGTLFLVLLADVDEQLNAGMGILGAVAGYLFGTMRRQDSDDKPALRK